eukprot:TRINITY_DN25377_c0_g1_i1.p1 TRINITY_DN25377_c0_g1~~TRINITY_DN25377_c0_g1_i1.p1  ORF type:complete len:182 (+),score=38.80 TRINITY_DN25377_c0_g1_i1:62-607(+)
MSSIYQGTPLNSLLANWAPNAITSTPTNLNQPIAVEIQYYMWDFLNATVTKEHQKVLEDNKKFLDQKMAEQAFAVQCLKEKGLPIPVELTMVGVAIGPITLTYVIDSVRQRITTKAYTIRVSMGDAVVTEDTPYIYNINQWIYSGMLGLRIVHGEFWVFGAYNRVTGDSGNLNQKICDVPW